MKAYKITQTITLFRPDISMFRQQFSMQFPVRVTHCAALRVPYTNSSVSCVTSSLVCVKHSLSVCLLALIKHATILVYCSQRCSLYYRMLFYFDRKACIREANLLKMLELILCTTNSSEFSNRKELKSCAVNIEVELKLLKR